MPWNPDEHDIMHSSTYKDRIMKRLTRSQFRRLSDEEAEIYIQRCNEEIRNIVLVVSGLIAVGILYLAVFVL